MSQVILVVEDDESIREMLRYYFQSVGYTVRAYESGEAMFEGEQGQDCPVLCILDIMLPGMDGLEILRRLRADRDRESVPVILLTARTAEMDRVNGLEAGADDYVVKPFGIMELQARVKAVLRRTRRGVALTRDEILQSVWDYDYTGETRTVDMHVKTLRQKLGEEYITTVRGVGYKMN